MDQELAEARAAEANSEAAEEQRLREEAEAGSERFKHLANCHQSFHTSTVVTDKSSTTQGNTAHFTERQFPQRIVPWPDFLFEQDEIWKLILTRSEFHSREVFPSLAILDYVRRKLEFISPENNVRAYARETVENHVQNIVEELYKDEQLRDALRFRGEVDFGYDTNLWDARQSRDCILEQPGGEKVPFMVIEYKLPRKLSLDNMIAGLSDGEIRPAEDVINKEAKSFEATSKALVAAVITQLFSYMIRKGIRWGYICTLEANIFLHIPGEPSVVYYHLSIPKLDFQSGDENRIYRTAVAQVSAFVLRAMNTAAPTQSWRDEVEKLPVWPLEHLDDILATPELSKSSIQGSEYTEKLRDVYLRSPIVTRRTRGKQSCNEAVNNSNQNSHEDEDSETPDTQKRGANTGTEGDGGKHGQGKKHTAAMSRTNINDRPYCSHRCLLGLAHGGPMDEKCPNIQDHPRKHIKQETFLRLIRDQLATDRGENTDCTELNFKGSRGALFKVRLSACGYTLVAKGVEWYNVKYLDHEHKIYEHIRSIQGTLVPVCLGSVELELPQYFQDGEYVKMLFLSWAGRRLFNCPDQNKKDYYVAQMKAALQKLHQLQVLHKDAESRNILWNEQCQSLMFVDFERAEVRTITPNQNGTENQAHPIKDDFGHELRRAIRHFSRSLES